MNKKLAVMDMPSHYSRQHYKYDIATKQKAEYRMHKCLLKAEQQQQQQQQYKNNSILDIILDILIVFLETDMHGNVQDLKLGGSNGLLHMGSSSRALNL